MIVSFKDEGTRHIFQKLDSRAARNACPQTLWPAARIRLGRLQHASRLLDLKLPPGNRLEALRGDRFGQYSIRVNEQDRLCFRWDGGAVDVEIVDYH